MFKQTRKNTDNASTLLSPIFSINGNNYKSLDRCPKIIMAVIVYLPVKLMKAFFSLWLWAHILEVDRLISTSVQFSHSVASNSLRFHGLQHARLPCLLLILGACSNSCPLSQWCHPTISSCHPLLLLPSIFPSIRGFSSVSALHIRWPKYWSFRLSISPSNEYSGLISFRIDWFDLHGAQGTLKSLLQHHSLKASILQHSAFLMIQFSHHTWLLEKP